mgnify:CR=1 FL=1
MSFLIKPPVTVTLKPGSFSGGDGRFPTVVINIINQLVAVISPISQDLAAVQADWFQQWDCHIDIVPLSLAQPKINRITVCIYNCMDFCAGPATAMANQTCWPPFFAPALCWWAFTMEASRLSSCNSASRLRTRKILSR